jgi:hypothetical protein
MTKPLTALLLHAVLLIAAATMALSAAAQSAKANNRDSALAGEWRGDSICVVRESACRDEVSLYHLSQDPEKPGRFLMRGDKIVDGKPVTMGTVGCGYDLKSHTLECAIPSGGVIRLLVHGSEMRGTMTLADKTEWRKITLKKIGPEDPR